MGNQDWLAASGSAGFSSRSLTIDEAYNLPNGQFMGLETIL